jgi:hypothetical protein
MQTLSTLARHGITYLVGLLTASLAVYLTNPEELKTATDAAHALIEPLVVLAGFAAVIVSRLAMPAIQKIFRQGAGEDSGGSAGGLNLLIVGGMMMIGTAAVGTLPSCSSYPVSGFVKYTDPQTGAEMGLKVGDSAQPSISGTK